MKLDKPEGKPDDTVGWGSDIAAQMLRRFNIPYVSLNPGASYRGAPRSGLPTSCRTLKHEHMRSAAAAASSFHFPSR